MKKKDKAEDAPYHHVDPEFEKTISELIVARFQSRRLKRKLSDKKLLGTCMQEEGITARIKKKISRQKPFSTTRRSLIEYHWRLKK
jgi:hypothetical protein